MRKNSDFKRTYSKRRSFVSELVVLYVAANSLERTRVGFVVSKKLGKAVARNRAKRVMREAMRGYLGCLHPGFDLVVVGRRRTVEAKSYEVGAELERGLCKFGLITPRDG